MAQYNDIVLLGRSRLGKTTLAKKLINLGPPKTSQIEITSEGSAETCKLCIYEEAQIRVLDTPGFSGVSGPENQHVIDCIGKAQAEYQLKVSRIVYFIPERGPLEKADGSMQEELKLLSRYFGKEIFNCMVVVATNNSRAQQVGFDDEDYKKTRKAFHVTLKSVINEDRGCPPVVYIGLNESHANTLQKIADAPVLKAGVVSLTIKDPSPPVAREPLYHRRFVPRYSSTQKIIGCIAHIFTLGIIYLIVYSFFGFSPWPGLTNTEKKCIDCGSPPDVEECTGRKKHNKNK